MLPLSAQDILVEARTDIEAARKARGSKHTVIKHYRSAKKALDKVSNMGMDISVFEEAIAAFQDLAVVLDNSEEQLQEKAVKCRQRADTLR